MSCILQWNCRGLRANLPELKLLISRFAPIAVCLSETQLADDKLIVDRNYLSYIKNNIATDGRACGGVNILVHKSIPHSEIKLNTILQAVAVKLAIHKVITLCSLYLSPSHALDNIELNNLLQQLPPPVLLLGDFNAHSPVCGCQNLNKRGKQIEDFMSSNNLCILNGKQHTYIHPATGSSSIDLSICSPAMMPQFKWDVHDDLCGSDHFPVVVRLTKSLPTKIPERWKLNKADWTTFTALCKEQLNEQTTDSIEQFTNNPISICNKTIPKTSTKLRKLNPPWFTEVCHQSVKERQRALRQFQANNTTANLNLFKLQRARTRKTIRENKRSSWRAYVNQLNTTLPPKRYGLWFANSMAQNRQKV